jgi:hypothetical protein
VFGVALLAAGCDIRVGDSGVSVGVISGRASDEWQRTYDIAPGGELAILNANGMMRASAAEGRQVEVHARREVRAGSEDEAREILRNAAMREEVTDEGVSIQPPDLQGRRLRQPLTIHYEVRVPAGLSVRLVTQNGEVRLDGIQGTRISASTTNGGVTGRALSGAVEASTVNGGIRMDLQSVTGDTRLTTVNGGVQLTLPASINADLEADAVNGSVQIDSGFNFMASEQGRQRLVGRINSGGPRIVVRTTNGGSRVTAGAGG